MKTAVFPGNYDSLAEIAEFVRQAAQDFGLAACAVYAVETAVDEACSNIIEHAYGGENIGDIVCTIQIQPDELVIRLQDTGRSFDPDQVQLPDVNAPLEEREDHGLGLYMMRQWMDEVQFSFDEGGNTVTLTKRKEQPC